MDKFHLSENPMRPDEGGMAIIKTIPPIGIFEVHEGHVFFDVPKYRKSYRHYKYHSEEYTLSLHYYGGFKGTPPTEQEAEKQAMNDMDNAWYWFMAYMKWEDEQI